MADLLENGDIRGPRSGHPLTDGTGRVLDVDVSAVTRQGRERLERARMALPVRSWDAVGPQGLGAAWKIVAGVVVAVLAAYLIVRFSLKFGGPASPELPGSLAARVCSMYSRTAG